MMGGGFGGGGSASPAAALDLSSLALPPALAAAVTGPGVRRDPAAGAVAATMGTPGGDVSVAYARLLGPDSLALAVWVCNRGAAPLAGATLAFAPHPALSIAPRPSGAVGPVAARGGTAAILVSVALTGLPAPSPTDGHSIAIAGAQTGVMT